MKILQIGLLICTSLLSSAFYLGIKGTVVDDVTGEPIEGAVVAAQWTKTKGVPGLTYGVRVKIVEAVTDKHGIFSISGSLDPFVNPPRIVIYKGGYFAWYSRYIFQESKNREDFKWESGKEYRLERFIKGYSHSRHLGSFTSDFDVHKCPKLDQAIDSETSLAQKERLLYSKKRRKLMHSSDNWKKIDLLSKRKIKEKLWNETLQELYFSKEGNKNE
jgi:hypothetical protein